MSSPGHSLGCGKGFLKNVAAYRRRPVVRIQENTGAFWRQQTVDNFIVGTADTPVKGIATAMIATLDVNQRATSAGLNMAVRHESTFFSHQDTVEGLQEDATYRFKRDFLVRNGMVVFHFYDHWHARRPDGSAAGMSRELGWEKSADADNPRLFSFSGVPLARLSREM